MKTTKQNQFKQTWHRAVSMFALLMIASFLTTGCGSNNNNNAPAVIPGGYQGIYGGGGMPNCAGCPTSSRVLTSAISRSQMGEMGLDFFGDMQSIMASVQMGMMYRGPFAATGYLFLPMGLPQCGIPGGRFMLQTQSPGIWGNDGAGRSGEQITLVAVGPMPLSILLSGYTVPMTPAPVGADGRQWPNSFQTTTMIVVSPMAPSGCPLYMQ